MSACIHIMDVVYTGMYKYAHIIWKVILLLIKRELVKMLEKLKIFKVIADVFSLAILLK